MFHLTNELVTAAQLADRYRAADRGIFIRAHVEPNPPGRAALVRIGRLLVALGRRLEALDARCVTATGRPVDAVAAAHEC